MRGTSSILYLLFVASVALSGCAGSGEGLDSNGRPFGSDDPQGPLTADFDSIQAHVFTPICTACHIGATAPQGLRLDAANSYNLLVSVPSTEVPGILRVKPGDPDNSYMLQKLKGTAAVGAQMPFGGPPLPDETIAVIRQWILDGAQRSPAAAVSETFQLTTVSPADGEVVGEAPKQIILGFNRELDATRADASIVRLERFEPANPEAPAIAAAATVSVPAANPLAILLTLHKPLAAGHYRVIIDARDGSTLTALDGQRLPATDAATNGEQVITSFTLETPP